MNIQIYIYIWRERERWSLSLWKNGFIRFHCVDGFTLDRREAMNLETFAVLVILCWMLLFIFFATIWELSASGWGHWHANCFLCISLSQLFFPVLGGNSFFFLFNFSPSAEKTQHNLICSFLPFHANSALLVWVLLFHIILLKITRNIWPATKFWVFTTISLGRVDGTWVLFCGSFAIE